jgi:hypothetical protein
MNDAIVTLSNMQAVLELHNANSLQRVVDSDEQYGGDVCLLIGRKLAGAMESDGNVVLVRWLWLWLK